MCAVKARFVLVVICAAALACAAGTPARATSVPCWKQIFNEWSRTNKIAATYPLHCYHDALAHLKDFPDADLYSSFADDDRSALAAAVARGSHKPPPRAYLAQLRRAKQKGHPTRTGTTSTSTTSTRPTTSTTDTTALDPASSGGGGGGIPTPLLVLGAIAVILLAAGGIGGAVRLNRARRGA